jgi:hypothetical protein
MKTSMRFVSLLILSFVIAAPAIAACRANSSLDISQIIDPTPGQTKITRIDSKNFLVFFAVRSTKNVSFMCDKKVPGCTPDGITYKPAISSNVAAANQTAECRAFQITVKSSGNVVAGFRIRFEQGISPAKKTYTLNFNTNDPSKFTLQSVNNLIDDLDL